jgi:hypothetical protein
MVDIKETINKIINNNKKIISSIQEIINKLINIYGQNNILIEDINKDIKKFKNDIIEININYNNIDDQFKLINAIELYSIIIQHIKENISKLINKTESTETYISQTFINETFMMYKELTLMINNISNLEHKEKNNIIEYIIHHELSNNNNLSEENVIKYIKYIQKLFYKNIYSIDLYSNLVSSILDKIKNLYPENNNLYYDILHLIENDKTYILSLINNKLTKTSKSVELNPYYKTFGLIPATNLLKIEEISNIIFKKSLKMKEFLDECKNKNYGLIIIKKHTRNPISYKTNQLLDWNLYKTFTSMHKNTYGIDKYILSQYKVIENINTKTKWDFSIDKYILKFNNFEEDKNKYTIILDSLAPDLYRINTNFLSSKNYFIKIGSIFELYKYCNSKESSRIGNFNNLCIKNTRNIIFNPIKYELDKVKEISSIVDPKYLRNEIYINMLNEFNNLLKHYKNIQDNYTYAKIIHNEKFLGIFSDILVREFYSYLYNTYNEYTTGHIKISEIISSFMNVIYINQRIFIKEIHDYFKNKLFDFSQDNILIKLKMHFDEMIRYVLDKIITLDNNIYQMILYKINLLKITLI